MNERQYMQYMERMYYEQLDQFKSAEPSMEKFNELIDFLWKKQNNGAFIPNSFENLFSVIEQENWFKWFQENSAECVLNSKFNNMCWFEPKRPWMDEATSLNCTKECIKRALKLIIKYTLSLEMPDIKFYYKDGDPLVNLVQCIFEDSSNIKLAMTDKKVYNQIELLGGEDMVKYWHKCLYEAGVIGKSQVVLDDI